MKDHIPRMLLILPKCSVANTVGFLKGKLAVRIFRDYRQVERNFTGRHYLVERLLCEHRRIRGADHSRVHSDQEPEEKRQEQMRLEGL